MAGVEVVHSHKTRRRSRSSDDVFFEPSPGLLGKPGMPEVLVRHPSLDRGRSVEYLDVLDESSDKGCHRSSTPDISSKKIKKKKHFHHVFHRHDKDKHRHHLDQRLTESLSVGQQQNSNGSTHLSLDNTWSHGSWRKLDSEMRNSSAHSSDVSLLSVEGEAREVSDEEMVESLVNPRRKSSFLASSVTQPLEHSISLAESEVGAGVMEYTVDVTLLSGHELAIRDRTGTSDPYVKFKCPPFKYRSAVVHRNLNPEWNEHFSFRTRNLHTPMLVRVYDHDYGSLDDYMGGQTLDLSSYAIDEQHIVDLGLVDPAIKFEELGFIRVFVKITLVTSAEQTAGLGDKKQKSFSSKVWSSVLTVTLLEGNNMPAMDQNGLSDPYCKFKLGSHKYKSKTQSKTLDPKWMQRFDMRMYDDCSVLYIEVWDKDFPQNDDFIGTCSVDLLTLPRDIMHDFTLPLLNKHNEIEDEDRTIHFTLCITGTKVEEEEAQNQTSECLNTPVSYGLLGSLDINAIKQRNIGHLCLTIDKVVDLISCNCFVLVELGNACVKTHSVGKTANPEWKKTFEFTVGDIHDELGIMVFKVGSRSDHLLGKISIPLHRLRSGAQQFALKDKHCVERTRGVLHIENEFVYNPVRAMICAINPREVKVLEAEQKFKKKVLMDNIKRVSNLARTILSTAEFVESTWSWQNKTLSIFSLLVFLVVTLFGDLWMALFVGVILFLYQYLVVFIRKDHVWQNRVPTNVHMISNSSSVASMDNEDSDFSDNIEDKRTSLREKFRLFQEILVLVQTYVGYVADAEEGLVNLLNWRVPFLSWMAILVCVGGTVLFYLIPIRYVILIWGINKYTKRLRKPNYISNNELLDFLSRCPTNKQLQQWHELPLTVYQRSASTKGHKRGTKKTK